jgi:hypothetical protein
MTGMPTDVLMKPTVGHFTMLVWDSVNWKEDCSAQNRPRALKLVPLEPTGNDGSEYIGMS